MSPLPLYQVDAFAHAPFTGNPAAVCLLEAGDPRTADASWMQGLAAEMNLSETAFAYPVADQPAGSGDFHLRWFTPACEVDLCGHATLATAHVLWEQGVVPAQTEVILFQTRSGELAVKRTDVGLAMDFPATPATERFAHGEELLHALGVAAPQDVWSNGMDALLELPDVAAVQALQPDFPRLAELDMRGVIVTAVGHVDGHVAGYGAKAGQEVDFVSRFFAPAAGIEEDPVTGSAHCTLAPYWQAQLGKQDLYAFQCSSRGGFVRMRCQHERVILMGDAITIFSGECHV